MIFKERINMVLADRALTLWGKENQLSGGTISRISGGQVPGSQILNLIQKIENVSIGWLLDGKGHPFITHEESSDKDLADYLKNLNEERGWQVYMLTDGLSTGVVYAQPGEFLYKTKTIPYTIIEVVTGPFAEQSLEQINKGSEIYYALVEPGVIRQLYQGELGTFKLFGDHRYPGILHNAEAVECIDMLESTPGIEESPEKYVDDSELLGRYHQLSAHNQKSISMIIATLLEQQSQLDGD